jgi:hypothetical protein
VVLLSALRSPGARALLAPRGMASWVPTVSPPDVSEPAGLKGPASHWPDSCGGPLEACAVGLGLGRSRPGQAAAHAVEDLGAVTRECGDMGELDRQPVASTLDQAVRTLSFF